MKPFIYIVILLWHIATVYIIFTAPESPLVYVLLTPHMIAVAILIYFGITVFLTQPAERALDDFAYRVGLKSSARTCVNCGTSVRWRDGDSLICPSCGQPLNVKLGKR